MTINREYITFSNHEPLDLRMLTTFGLSVKNSTSPIGMFGTGLKYAIAVLLRNNCEVKLKIDDTYYTFHTQKHNIRNTESSVIYMHNTKDGTDIQLPMTDNFGRNWKVWQAIRELYSNCLDEGGRMNDVIEQDRTVIYVKGEEAEKVLSEFHYYFIDPTRMKLVYSGQRVDIYERFEMNLGNLIDGVNTRVFYRGIYTGNDWERSASFIYNFKTNMTLTEDRSILHAFEPKNALIDEILSTCYDEEFLMRYINNAFRDSMEGSLTYNRLQPSSAFINACKTLLQKDQIIPSWAMGIYEQTLPMIERYKTAHLSTFDEAMLTRVIKVLAHHDEYVSRDQIRVVRSLRDNVMGMYIKKDDTILINREVFNRGEVILLGTIYEELLHKRHDFEDESRTMQNYLVDKVASLLTRVYNMEKDNG